MLANFMSSLATSIGCVDPNVVPGWLWLVVILGPLAVIWIIYSVVWFCLPIRRDRVIAEKEGRFLIGVVAFVVAVPLAISSLIMVLDCRGVSSVTPDDLFVQNDNYEPDSQHGILWTIYFHYIDPGNQSNATAKGNKWVMLVSLLGMFLINGLMVTTILNWIDQRKEQRRNGKIRYSRGAFLCKKYAVVIGANEVASSVIKNLLSREDLDYVILQTSSDVGQVRDTLASHLPMSYIDKIIFYSALRDSQEEIESLYLNRAADIYILGENTSWDGGETYHDAISMRCLTIVANLMKREKEKIGNEYRVKDCKVLFDYQTTNSVFYFSDLSMAAKNTLNIIPFNRYEAWAKMIMVDNCANEIIANTETENILGSKITNTVYRPLDGDGIGKDSPEHVHLVIVGMSKMGVALGVQAMLQAHYPNFDDRDEQPKRTRITFIDTHADTEMAFFKGRYVTLFELMRHRYIDTIGGDGYKVAWKDPIAQNEKWRHLGTNGRSFLDIEVEFVKGSIESDNVRTILQEIVSDDTAKITIAICLTQTYQAVAAGLYLPLEIYEKKNVQNIWVYQREVSDIIKGLNNAQSVSLGSNTYADVSYDRYLKLKPFGMLFADHVNDPIRTARAMLVNSVYDLMSGQGENDLLKIATKNWERLPLLLRMSNHYFVDTIEQKLRSVQVDVSKLKIDVDSVLKFDALARSEHNRWNIEKLLFGYTPCDKDTCEELIRLLCEKKGVEYKHMKDELKKSTKKVHPDICACDILKKVDPGAEGYDMKLNTAIPKIIELASEMINLPSCQF